MPSVAQIIGTLGPASSNITVLRKMVGAGMDAVRLNFSHGSHDTHKRKIDLIRRLNQTRKTKIEILQDLEGFRVRIGSFAHLEEKTIPLQPGRTVVLSNQLPVAKTVIPFDYEGCLTDIKIGAPIYIDDGNLALQVKSRTRNTIKAQVLVGGPLKEHKGISMPTVNLKFSGLTDKDKHDLEFGTKHGVDMVAQSFVRSKKDMLDVRKFLEKRRFACKLIAKIENRQGIDNIDEILEVCDGIMVARGDMGVSLPIYEVPIMQKMLIRKCNQRRKIVITATQMLESMTTNIRPTRAEVSDVANAILDGSHYVMLSGETAVGKHPVKTVRMMEDIIHFTEQTLI